MTKIAPTVPLGAANMIALADQLEDNLAELDDLGAHIAAAHLDVAISRLRKMAGEEAVN